MAHKIVQRPAHVVAGDVQAAQHLERRALALAHDAEQQVLRGDVGLPHLHGLAQRVLQHALDARREGEVPRDIGVLINSDHLADGLHHSVVADVQAVECLGGETVLLLDEAEQDVLGAHVGLVKRARLILSPGPSTLRALSVNFSNDMVASFLGLVPFCECFLSGKTDTSGTANSSRAV